MDRIRIMAVVAALALPAAPMGSLAAQDGNLLLPADTIEELLAHGAFRVIDMRGSRAEGDRTNRAALAFPDETMIAVQWAPSAPDGETFNNSPRLELAAYAVQKLFLDEPDYVVPPTVLRAFPAARYGELDAPMQPTFRGTSSVLVTLQYWLLNVGPDSVWDPDRFERDQAYARHFGNFNILTYLIRHNDSNIGNYLISHDPENPRIFAVDNGLSFNSVTSDRGAEFRRLRVRRLPAATIDRLRSLTQEEVTARLETLAEFLIQPDGTLVPAEPTPNISRNRGVRQNDERIQLGLTQREIRDLWRRVGSILRDVDRGRIEVF